MDMAIHGMGMAIPDMDLVILDMGMATHGMALGIQGTDMAGEDAGHGIGNRTCDGHINRQMM